MADYTVFRRDEMAFTPLSKGDQRRRLQRSVAAPLEPVVDRAREGVPRDDAQRAGKLALSQSARHLAGLTFLCAQETRR